MIATETRGTGAEALGAAVERLAAAGCATARLDAEVLLAYACGATRSQMLARLRDPLPPATGARFEVAVARRAAREPVAHIVGRREFWSLDFEVDGNVLIPRPETELLVETAVALVRRRGLREPRLADVGTGSGCIAVALAAELPEARLWAGDVSAAALTVSCRNAQRLGVAPRIRFAAGDLLEPLRPGAPFDVICANPPYVCDEASLPPELAFEPAEALFAGADGLDVIRRLVAEAPGWLARGGALLIEIGQGQADAARALALAAGFAPVEIRDDYAAIPRLLVAKREE